MDDLRTILENLDEIGESYVWEKAKNPNASVGDVLKNLGFSTAKFYSAYPADERKRLDDIARRVYRNSQFRALKAMDEAAALAAQKLVHLMNNAKSEYVQLQSAQFIINQSIGTPMQRVDVTSGGDTIKLYSVVSPDDWDE